MKFFKIFKYLYLDFRAFLYAVQQGKKLRVTNEIANQRMEICKNCENLNQEFKIFNYKFLRCGICGCILRAKTKLTFENCPDNPPKWKSSF